MISRKCEDLYEKLKKSLDKSSFLCEKLIDLIDTQEFVKLEIQEKNLFYLDIIFQQLNKIRQSLNLIVVNPEVVNGLLKDKIISFDDYNALKQSLQVNDTVYRDLSNPINIFFTQDS